MQLTAEKRNILGKKVKHLRRQGQIIGELFGRGVENIHLAITAKEFDKVFKQAGENTVVKLNIAGDKEYPALIHNVSHNPVTDVIENVDFLFVRMDEKIKTSVPIEFIGESLAVKEGGILVKAMQQIEVEALPGNIPHHFEINLSQLAGIGDSLLVKDLSPADWEKKGVKILMDSGSTVAVIKEPVEEKEEIVATEIDVAAIKSETEEKKAEREAERKAEE